MLILAGFGEFLVAVFVSLLALLLIGLVLLQKNRGSGLSGAFGGVGGHSAFGTKTGDFLTWVTVGVTGAFLLTCVVGVYVYVPDYTSAGATIEAGQSSPGAQPGTAQPGAARSGAGQPGAGQPGAGRRPATPPGGPVKAPSAQPPAGAGAATPGAAAPAKPAGQPAPGGAAANPPTAPTPAGGGTAEKK